MASPQKARILISGHDFRFLKPLLDQWVTNPAYETRIEEHRSHEITEPQKCQEMLKQTDIVFCEWCLGNAVWYAKHKEPRQRLIVRLHSQELRLPFLEQVAWDRVDRVIFICPLHMNLMVQRYPELAAKSILIYNPIDCKALDKPKLFGAEFNLGFLGMCPQLKAPHLAVELLRRLKCIDRRYILFFKGKRPVDYPWLMKRREEREYYDKFFQEIDGSDYRNSVVFEDFDTDVAEWFPKIGFILSTSEREGSHQAVAEGMASGSLPIIRNWAGADHLYPDRFVFSTLDKAVELLLRLKTMRQYSEECCAVKRYAVTRFDQTVIASQYEKLLTDLWQSATEKRGAACLGVEAGPGREETLRTIKNSSKRSIVAMHVCFLTPGTQNGYAIRVVEETRALMRQNVEVVVACFIPESPPCPPREVDEFQRQLQERTGAKCYLLPTKQFFNIAFDPARENPITTSLVALAITHHVHVVHGQALYSTMHVLRARGKMNAKVVFDVHGISPEEMELSGAPPARIRTMSDWERRALEEVDLRVFVSARMRDHFRSKYGLATTLPHCIVPCCVHVDRFGISEEVRSLKRKEMGLDGRFVFLYLGSLSVWQWPEALFSVFAQFYQERSDGLLYLLLPHRDHEVALSFCRRHGLPQESYLLSEVPHRDVGLVAGLADVGLLLRKAHPVNAVASPTKLGEYLAAGLPVVATEDIGDTSDVIASNRLGLVISPTDEGLSAVELDRLVRFAEDVAATRRECSLRTKSAATLQLAWDRHAATLSNKYHELLNTAQSL
jgi:glycosyltransferase involved in cell wall biosynthesis